MELLIVLGGIFIARPWVALLPAVLFAALWWISRSRMAAAAAVAWLLYVGWEYTIKLHWTCSGDCDIRVDLLLLYPALGLLSVLAAAFGIASLVRRMR